jgi:hypothetical protein
MVTTGGRTRYFVAEFFGNEYCGVVFDNLVDRRHHAHFHQRFDYVTGFHGDQCSQFTDGDGVANRHFA